MLPFANMSRDADDEYFSDGLAEEIINAAGASSGTEGDRAHLGVRVQRPEYDIRKIAETLGVTNCPRRQRAPSRHPASESPRS